MNFEMFESMYALLWELIYNVLGIFGVKLDNGLNK